MKEELKRLESELDKATPVDDSKLDQLKVAQAEMNELLNYKREQAGALREDKESLQKALEEIQSTQNESLIGDKEKRLRELLSQLRQERDWLEKRKEELTEAIRSM